ncbi:MAG: hypothetical protein A3J97_07335 [Spirochaetes bacterium RIFOXYC1_FULL_54_7]|nr:MAG: hypothetical protein A3J97_07335 [Spirochaetes bacterium RIFOXYC1_FULL_54_7]
MNRRAYDNMTNLRILHLEDSPPDAELIRELLIETVSPERIDLASNEQEFTSFLKNGHYNLILADYHLPGFDAPAALRLAKLFCPDLPFIIVSGAIGEDKAVDILKLGATDYVLKTRLDKLPLAINRTLDEVRAFKACHLAESKLRTLVENVPDLIARFDADCRLTVVNSAFLESVPDPAVAVIGKTLGETGLPKDDGVNAAFEGAVRQVFDEGITRELESQLLMRGGVRIFEILLVPEREDNRKITSVLSIARDITERKCMEDETRTRESELIRLNRAMRMLILANKILIRASDEESLLKEITRIIVEVGGYISACVVFVDEGEVGNIVPEDDYNSKVVVFPLIGDGRTFGTLAITTETADISGTGEMKILEELASDLAFGLIVLRLREAHRRMEDFLRISLAEKETLLRELYHRTRNNMQVISSLLNLYGSEEGDEHLKSIFKDMASRIESMSLVQRELYESKNLTKVELRTYISDLVNQLSANYRSPERRICYSSYSDEIFLAVEAAIPIGLIINELIINSVHHAFEGRKEGNIHVELRVREGGGLRLSLSDDGVGLPEGFSLACNARMGLTTVDTLVRHQLGGQINFSTGEGFRVTIDFDGPAP